MRRARPYLWCLAAAYLAILVASAFLLPEHAPGWMTVLAYLVAGALLALLARRERWWVALGFVWLGSAWVEAGQAVWPPGPEKASVQDLLLGCLGGAIGVGIVTGARALGQRAAVSHEAAAAPSRR